MPKISRKKVDVKEKTLPRPTAQKQKRPKKPMQGVMSNLRKSLESNGKAPNKAVLIGMQCFSCQKLHVASTGTCTCLAFKRFYFDYDQPEAQCWGYLEDLRDWVESLRAMRDYALQAEFDALELDIDDPEALNLEKQFRAIRRQLDNELAHAEFRQKHLEQQEIHQAFFEDSCKRPRKPGGGGEKADRTNKMFGPERMKDNRYVEPWSGFFKG